MWVVDVVTLLAIASCLVVNWFVGHRKPRMLFALYGIAIVSVAAQIILDTQRWQLIPAELGLAMLLVAVPLISYRSGAGREKGWKRWGTTVFHYVIAIVILFSAALLYLFPIFALPQPSGPYAVGTATLHMIDHSRPEHMTAEADDSRELMVRAWYPAQTIEGYDRKPYWIHAEEKSSAFLSGLLNLPEIFGFLFEHLDQVPTQAYQEAPLKESRAPYPIVIFSHGMGLDAGQNTSLMEELASHGYITFSINHTYWNLLTVFPDGRSISAKIDDSGTEDENENPAAMALFDKLMASEDSDDILDLIERMVKLAPKSAQAETNRINVWSADQRFVIDEIGKMQTGARQSPFRGMLDVNRIGLCGMSMGGKATLQTCAFEERCKAGINIDGFSLVSVRLPPHERPFMHITHENNKLVLPVYNKSRGPTYYVRVLGSEHFDFTELPLFTPLFKIMGLSGNISGRRMLEITNSHVLSFFDKHLMGADKSALSELAGRYDEVIYMSK